MENVLQLYTGPHFTTIDEDVSPGTPITEDETPSTT
jgi:hypothetical protein